MLGVLSGLSLMGGALAQTENGGGAAAYHLASGATNTNYAKGVVLLLRDTQKSWADEHSYFKFTAVSARTADNGIIAAGLGSSQTQSNVWSGGLHIQRGTRASPIGCSAYSDRSGLFYVSFVSGEVLLKKDDEEAVAQLPEIPFARTTAAPFRNYTPMAGMIRRLEINTALDTLRCIFYRTREGSITINVYPMRAVNGDSALFCTDGTELVEI